MEPTLRSAQLLRQEAEELGNESKYIAQYVRQHQVLNKEHW